MMIPSLNGNWVDLVIILVLLYYALDAWRYGFLSIVADFGAFLGSLLISLRVYKFGSDFLKANFSLSNSLANALGFVATSIILEIILGYLFALLIRRLPKKIRHSKYNRLLGLVPAVGEGVILIAFLLTTIISLPIKPQVKKDISESKIGNYILKETAGVEKSLNEVFGGAFNDALTYFTVEPGSKSKVSLKNGIDHLTVDRESEIQMFAMVNKERTSRGISSLSWSPRIVGVAEAYAMDMWNRHYFSHYSPEGKDVGDRLSAAGIAFTFAGENLALAPTLETAMNGLMNSEGHRENILDSRFHIVGIGVVDNGIYGKIFVQVFTN